MEDINIDKDGDGPDIEQDAFEDAVADEKRRAEHAVQYLALEKAWAAAEAGDPIGMLTHIHESRYLDGLFRVLRSTNRFDDLPDSEIEMAIAEGVENFYERVKSGAKILNLPAYLWKTVQRCALAKFRQNEAKTMSAEPLDLEGKVSPLFPDSVPQVPGEEAAEKKTDSDQRRRAMLQFAKKILPRLGQENIQKVMASLLAAIERSEIHWPPSAIAAETGLKPNTVSVLLTRGFERMSREAAKEGLQDPEAAKQFIESFKTE